MLVGIGWSIVLRAMVNSGTTVQTLCSHKKYGCVKAAQAALAKAFDQSRDKLSNVSSTLVEKMRQLTKSNDVVEGVLLALKLVYEHGKGVVAEDVTPLTIGWDAVQSILGSRDSCDTKKLTRAFQQLGRTESSSEKIIPFQNVTPENLLWSGVNLGNPMLTNAGKAFGKKRKAEVCPALRPTGPAVALLTFIGKMYQEMWMIARSNAANPIVDAISYNTQNCSTFFNLVHALSALALMLRLPSRPKDCMGTMDMMDIVWTSEAGSDRRVAVPISLARAIDLLNGDVVPVKQSVIVTSYVAKVKPNKNVNKQVQVEKFGFEWAKPEIDGIANGLVAILTAIKLCAWDIEDSKRGVRNFSRKYNGVLTGHLDDQSLAGVLSRQDEDGGCMVGYRMRHGIEGRALELLKDLPNDEWTRRFGHSNKSDLSSTSYGNLSKIKPMTPSISAEDVKRVPLSRKGKHIRVAISNARHIRDLTCVVPRESLVTKKAADTAVWLARRTLDTYTPPDNDRVLQDVFTKWKDTFGNLLPASFAPSAQDAALDHLKNSLKLTWRDMWAFLKANPIRLDVDLLTLDVNAELEERLRDVWKAPSDAVPE
ncbi:hypothetical protein CEUSTIGMA_g12209.t1 [Chlamydomonas eustigma]|uniref:Uncharacterized protein n=1 Tax=Chlamydomonas eustigma TaxID=1157962 RepID=A0A250XP05_9CHLO|nr:hypothetical protein CEUSTIGMA_g12209.t1 [Chlamydomonas eustigma]|eukprot:GAX84788.1 hypothetical protein CEUSTIGMA_g12209.t1 [Chlamydomonas eustigma]